MNTCRECETQFYHSDGRIDVCRDCYEEGAHAALLVHLRALGAVARLTHTGGGCRALEVKFPSGRFVAAAAACLGEAGRWLAEVFLPDPGKPWAATAWKSRRAWSEPDPDDEPLADVIPATDDELVAFCAQHSGRRKTVKEFRRVDFMYVATCRQGCGALARYRTEVEATTRAIAHVEMSGHDAAVEEERE